VVSAGSLLGKGRGVASLIVAGAFLEITVPRVADEVWMVAAAAVTSTDSDTEPTANCEATMATSWGGRSICFDVRANPGAVIANSYRPAGSPATLNCPIASVRALPADVPAIWRSVTVAPGTTAPVGSVTVPAIPESASAGAR
jgi:hypothetical protein